MATSTRTLRGRRATYGPGLALVARLVPSWRRCRRGCGRCRLGTWRYGHALCVAGVALGDIDLHSAWQAWHLRHWAGSGGNGLALVARKTCRSSILSRLLLRCRQWSDGWLGCRFALCSFFGVWSARCATYGWQAQLRMFPGCVLRCRHGHVYFFDTSCEHDQTDGWVVSLHSVVALAFGVRDALRMAGRHVWRCFLAAFFDAGTDMFTSLTLAANMIRRMAGLSLCFVHLLWHLKCEMRYVPFNVFWALR